MLPTRWLDAGLDPRNTPSGLLRHARVASAVGAGLAAGAGGLTAAGLLVDPRLGAAAGLLLGVALLNLALLRSGLVRIRRDLEASSRHDHDRVVELAFHDALTGLPNRQHFQERLGESLYAASRHDRTAALLFLDLDGFKMVNDSLGHSAGDRLLREVAGRLRSSVRLTDAVGRHADDDDGSVSRLGGDEFTVLLTELSDPVGAATVAKRILDALQRPIDVDGCEVHVGASIGIAICPADGVDPETLLRCADQAMYEAKSRGRNNFQFYTEALSRATERKVRVEARLRHALEEGGLELHYQPLREIASGRVARAEALLRWNDPELGPVPPSEFVPVAEQTGLVTSLGAWVIRTALLQARAWTEAGHRPIRLAANLSSRHLRHHSLVETVSAALTESGVSPELFELEITESSIMTDDPVTRDALGALSDLGVGLALDDFGTGFSSLAHLRILPFDRLKIDRSFVADLEENGDDRALVASVVQLAHSLGMRVAAEGVETEQQLAFLRERGCDEVQGYLIGAPAPAAELERFLEPEKADEA